MKTVTIDILNQKVIRILHDLELLQLIRVRKSKQKQPTASNSIAQYKGAMTKQPLTEVNEQLHQLRKEWE